MLQDVYMLKNQVFMMLITHQIVSQLQETILPIFLKRPSTRRVINKVSYLLFGKCSKIKGIHSDGRHQTDVLFDALGDPLVGISLGVLDCLGTLRYVRHFGAYFFLQYNLTPPSLLPSMCSGHLIRTIFMQFI